MSQFSYDDTRTSSHGTMICVACRKPITQGRYRSHVKTIVADWYYSCIHESCCKDDPEWVRIDAAVEQAKIHAEALSDACKAFKAAWPIDNELDDYILEERT